MLFSQLVKALGKRLSSTDIELCDQLCVQTCCAWSSMMPCRERISLRALSRLARVDSWVTASAILLQLIACIQEGQQRPLNRQRSLVGM